VKRKGAGAQRVRAQRGGRIGRASCKCVAPRVRPRATPPGGPAPAPANCFCKLSWGAPSPWAKRWHACRCGGPPLSAGGWWQARAAAAHAGDGARARLRHRVGPARRVAGAARRAHARAAHAAAVRHGARAGAHAGGPPAGTRPTLILCWRATRRRTPCGPWAACWPGGPGGARAGAAHACPPCGVPDPRCGTSGSLGIWSDVSGGM